MFLVGQSENATGWQSENTIKLFSIHLNGLISKEAVGVLASTPVQL